MKKHLARDHGLVACNARGKLLNKSGRWQDVTCDMCKRTIYYKKLSGQL